MKFYLPNYPRRLALEIRQSERIFQYWDNDDLIQRDKRLCTHTADTQAVRCLTLECVCVGGGGELFKWWIKNSIEVRPGLPDGFAFFGFHRQWKPKFQCGTAHSLSATLRDCGTWYLVRDGKFSFVVNACFVKFTAVEISALLYNTVLLWVEFCIAFLFFSLDSSIQATQGSSCPGVTV